MAQAHVLRIPIKPGMKGRVEEYLAKRASSREELDSIYARRGVSRTLMFVEARAGVDSLFIYRAGSNLETAGADFLLTDVPLEKEFRKLLLEATDVDELVTMPVAFCWPDE